MKNVIKQEIRTSKEHTSSKTCVKCKRKEGIITIPSLEQKACEQCFTQIIEKRFSKNLRKHYPNLKRVTIGNERESNKILYHLFKKKQEKAHNLQVKKGRKTSIPAHTLDELATSILKSFLTGKNQIIIKHSPIEDTSEEELKQYARINNIEYKGNKRKRKDERIHEMILEMNERRPGVLYSIKKFKDKLTSTT